MNEYPTLKYIELLPGYRIFAIFDDGSIKLYALQERLQSPPFSALQDEALFYAAQIAHGGHGIVWNDELDLSEYEIWSKGRAIASVEALAAQAG